MWAPLAASKEEGKAELTGTGVLGAPLGRIASGVTAVGRYSGGPLDIALS